MKDDAIMEISAQNLLPPLTVLIFTKISSGSHFLLLSILSISYVPFFFIENETDFRCQLNIEMDFQLNVMRVFVIGVDNVSVGSEGPKIGRARVTGGEWAVLGAGIGSWGMLRRGSRTGWLGKAPE